MSLPELKLTAKSNTAARDAAATKIDINRVPQTCRYSSATVGRDQQEDHDQGLPPDAEHLRQEREITPCGLLKSAANSPSALGDIRHPA
ncbi:hypothetical protein [Bradyrhizobium sp. 192]|uniref:hypothetical protein n=1 Tax=Bradyrhizobium sp. 192 TaxID=2782660 RepID=UPI001FFE98A7|nr:hypothetical protein [Bradyrhizobium sp. 192]UPJ55473.1 hypothetical protein IVB24_22730 [Bradyrhizobium sp. 192]